LKDTYHTVAHPSEGDYKEKGSKFIAYAYEVDNEADIKDCLEEVKKEHFKARHHCYAYRLGLDGNNYRMNDDGEPSSTAGRPILGQIDSFELTNVFVVVVRYFGGTKLGTSGLKRAYKTASKDALSKAKIVKRIIKKQFDVTYDYAVTADVMNFLKGEDFDIIDTNYDQKAALTVAVRLNNIDFFEETLAKIDTVKTKLLS